MIKGEEETESILWFGKSGIGKEGAVINGMHV
jgi:hypothetical protein